MLGVLRASARVVARCPSASLTCTGGSLRPQKTFARNSNVNSRPFTGLRRYRQATELVKPVEPHQDIRLLRSESPERAKQLPLVCPGCGAPSQTVDPESAGFYGSKRADKAGRKSVSRQEEDEIFQNAVNSGAFSSEISFHEGQNDSVAPTSDMPLCDRCHYILYQSRGTSIIHPSMRSIQDIIEESPHKHNHIYHILDAADFPMSLIPNLQNALKLPRLRTQNRRSKSVRYVRGRVAEVSFIITRSDLLAPQKEQVDTLVPYLREVLRDALGRNGRNVRLGNVRCVSAKRGWWTKTVKEDIWDRGGAGWMVGKANVGKSALYEVVFPKGRHQEDANIRRIREGERNSIQQQLPLLSDSEKPSQHLAQPKTAFSFSSTDTPGDLGEIQGDAEINTVDPASFQESEVEFGYHETDPFQSDKFFDEDEGGSLLPPAQPETPFPHMPLVSALPGTTASPIRIPFGNGKGELIDLPGIHRSFFDSHINPEHRKSLVMKSRVVPQQHTIKPGQSILVGGTIRITPKTDDLIFLAYPFVPIPAHVTSNEKAIAIQTGVFEDGEPYAGTVESIANDAAKQKIKKAGTFQLEWDVTKRRAGPLTDLAAGKQRAANLPFIVYSADLLIEGVGWIELVCQVRNRRKSFITETVVDALGTSSVKKEAFPEVEVWSPEGKFVAVRRPMNAWLLGGPKQVPKHARHVRPRQSISFARRKAGGAAGGSKKVAHEE